MNKHILRVIAIVTVLACLFLTACGSSDPNVRYEEFYSLAKAEFKTPGLNDGFIPQGLAISGDNFLVSGYMTDSAARVYVVGENNYYVTLKNVDGGDYTGHAGGIAVYGNDAYVASEGCLFRLSLKDILSAKNGDSVKFIDSFPLLCGAAYCYIINDCIFVGEFYEKRDYPTEDSHKVVTPSGDKNNALLFCYKLTDGGIASKEPQYVISTREKVQGLSITESGKFLLSTSYGRKNDSHVFVYSGLNEKSSTITLSNNDYPLYYLDSATLEKDILSPSMTEGMCYNNGLTYVVTESSAIKYKDSAFLPTDDVFSLAIS